MFSLLRSTKPSQITKFLASNPLKYSFSNAQQPNSDGPKQSSVDPKEVEIFSKVKDWWDANGSQRALHAYNVARVNYIKRMYHIHAPEKIQNRYFPFEGVDLIDVGCGAGIFCESAARLKGNVLGIDATRQTLEIAKAHAEQDPSLDANLKYVHTTAETVAEIGKKFDVVTSLEVIEHVADKRFFIEQLVKLTKDGGFVFISTINKTLAAYGVTILGAEILTRIVPYGTHEWDKFISPEDLCNMLRESGLKVLNVQGFMYNPFANSMREVNDTSVNYIVTCKKE